MLEQVQADRHRQNTERADRQEETLKEIKTLVELQNGRVRKLEDWRNRLSGMWMILVPVLSLLGSIFGGVVTFLLSQAVKNHVL